jgi:hypothetical protein
MRSLADCSKQPMGKEHVGFDMRLFFNKGMTGHKPCPCGRGVQGEASECVWCATWLGEGEGDGEGEGAAAVQGHHQLIFFKDKSPTRFGVSMCRILRLSKRLLESYALPLRHPARNI